MPSGNPPARRRGSDEIRALVLNAARELFAEQGYEDTTTRQIAHKAGVLEHLIFRNFTNKAGLFDAAVVTPLAELVAGYATKWDQDRGNSTPEERIADFVEGLFELARSNRTLLLAVLARSEGGQSGVDELLDHIAATLHGLEGIEAIDEYPDLDPPATMAAVTGMVVGVALFDKALFPSSTRKPSRQRLITEMTKIISARLDRPQR